MRLPRLFIGMVANDFQNPTPAQQGPHGCLSQAQLELRLEEEVNRAGRHRTALSCLLVSLEEVERLALSHGERFPEQAIAYLGMALRRELRLFDRVGRASETELVVVLPGADERRGEIVARRALARLHAVKIEVAGARHPLRISVGIAAWREGLTAAQLLHQTRCAAVAEERSDRGRPSPSGATGETPGELPALRRS